MKKIHKAYKFELKPNQEEEILLNKHFGCSRFVFNYFLNQRQEQYEKTQKSDNYYKQAKFLTQLKKRKETLWLKEVNSQMLQSTLKNLDTAYQNFFKTKSKFPRFKSKKSRNSFHIPQHIRIKKDRIYIPKFKRGIKVNFHRKIQGTIRHCTFSKNASGKYFVSITVIEKHKTLKKTGKSVGIDLGLKDFAITSDKIKYKNHRHTKKYAKKLKLAQKHLSRKAKQSNSFEKQRRKVARIHERITNSRQDNLHKISTALISKYDVICLEDLHIKGMIRNRKLSKHIADASWATFVRFLEYKADWNDKKVIKIDRFFASSKTCHSCSWLKKDLELSDRIWTCRKCKKIHDRDINASLNILKEGLKILQRA